MIKIDTIYEYTKDDLRLMGILYQGIEKEYCVVCIHGMAGSIMENYFADVWGKLLAAHNISFLFGHTRGYSYINQIPTKKKDYKEIGTSFELFEESYYDVDLWVKKAKQLGYQKIILLGHSLGCNKVINYLSKENELVEGLVLASPPDIVGLIKNKKYQPDYEELINEARKNITNGNPKKMISKKLWDEHWISSQTLLNYTSENTAIDNLPILRNPQKFSALEKIKIPIFAFLGEKDDIIIRSTQEDLELIKQKSKKCPSFQYSIIPKATHIYEGYEEEAGFQILNWIKTEIIKID